MDRTNYYARNHKDDGEYYAENPAPIKIDIMQMLLITSILCSSDTVAAVSIIEYAQQPKLFSCIFGEGVVNDAVSIILFNTVLSLQTVEFTWTTPFLILYQFCVLGFVSIAIGVVFGLFTSFIFKNASFLRVSAITETFLLLAFSMTAYYYAEVTVIAGIKMSGIISLLTVGIV
jgi:NhaP-type Na+/H+ or K+/H+ antiporter